MYTIATAGHIDHGKSSLVRALTGTDPDRLPEEKEREMTIELGFASFKLSTGEEVGIVDVPGHERFIKNMISGVGALDMVMFVVAADDGWMPQSEEHLAILRYLGLQRGIIVLTKVDMVDPDWKDMVKNDLRQKTQNTFLDGCDIIEFSALDNRNLDAVRDSVERMLKSVHRDLPGESARLYADRVFTIAGTGTVVTGTLRDGTFAVGQEVYHHPSGQKTKVKNLESFYSHLDRALPGVRLAVGTQALERGAVKRGDLFYTSRQLQESDTLGVSLTVEPRQLHLIKHNRDIIFLHGTSEIAGRLFLPDDPLTARDGEYIVVLRLDAPVIVKAGDRFILRLPTPSLLLGGGTIIDPVLELFKRSDTERWKSLQSAAATTPKALIEYQLIAKGIVAESDLLAQSLVAPTQVAEATSEMIRSGSVIKRDRFFISAKVWNSSGDGILAEVNEFHKLNPHLASMSLAALVQAVKIPQVLFDQVLDALLSDGKLERHEAGIRVKQHAAELSSAQKRAMARLLAMLTENPRQSVNRDDLLASDKEARKIFAYLKQNGEIVDLGGTIYLKATFENFASEIVNHIKTHGKITVAEARDITDTSRKVILPLLEDLDRRHITKRDGDYRTLWQ